MAASFATLNRNETGSWGAWGFPDEARKRFHAVNVSFGTTLGTREAILTWGRPRVVDVLYVYPKDLTSVEERFGSWMVQYAYCNYCPADRITRLGRVEDGKLKLGIAAYSTVVVGFEPFYDEAFVDLLVSFAVSGGRVIWNSTPPADASGQVPDKWKSLFGIRSVETLTEGRPAARVTFGGILSGVPEMNVLTDMLPDRTYTVSADGVAAAFADGRPIGTGRTVGKGYVCYLGCRLRNDQTGDSGDGPRTLFYVLKTLGAYGGPGASDQTETVSLTTPYFATKFANGTTSVCRHYYPMKELWEGGFGRDQAHDAESLRAYPYMVPTELDLEDFALEGRRVTYHGTGALQYRLDDDGRLIGFLGTGSTGVTIDGRTYRLTEQPAYTIFGRLENERLPDGYTAGWEVATTAPVIDLCCDIPADAELYVDTLVDGLELVPDARLSLSGSVLTKGDAHAVVILVK